MQLCQSFSSTNILGKLKRGAGVQVQASKGHYRVIGQGRFDPLAWPSLGQFCKDCETFNEAKELADRHGAVYYWTYIYDDDGELLYKSVNRKRN